MLPVGILDPAFEQRLIEFVDGVLQIVQTDEQSDGCTYGSEVRAMPLRKWSNETISVEILCHRTQPMTVIEQLLILNVEQMQLAAFRCRSGLHAASKL